MRIRTHRELRVWSDAVDLAMRVFEMTSQFPQEERYSLVDQVRRSSRSVAANIGEAWRKRRYRAAFVSKLNDAESEACETQVWIEFALRCGYVAADAARTLDDSYEKLISQIVVMIQNADDWLLSPPKRDGSQ
jgi:four helix bundle protein